MPKKDKYVMDDIKAARISECIKKKINFISGTVTPVQANKTKDGIFTEDDLEHIESGISFMFSMHKSDKKTLSSIPSLTLAIQPKFMGSRCNMYLFRDNHETKSYCVTRNGFLCKLPRDILKPLYTKMKNRLDKFMTGNNVEMMILDGELLPWSALGTSLIENEFLPVDEGLRTEIEYSKKYDFDTQLLKLQDHIKTKTSDTKTKTLSMIFDANILDSKTSQDMYEIYHEQMVLYARHLVKDEIHRPGELEENIDDGSESIADSKLNDNNYLELSQLPLEYKAFGILKICFNDGSESVPLIDHTFSQSAMYNLVKDPHCELDNQLVVEIDEKNFDKSVETIKKFFKDLTYDKGFEGVVIKPDYITESTLLPMMKCRNTSYLSIVYGYDYKTEPKLTRLIQKKSTKTKIKQSIREFQKGIDMLRIKYTNIETDPSYRKLMLRFIYDEEEGVTLDPRL